MNRRTVIAGLGSLTASGGLAIGSGAFSSVRADRTVSIETARDSDALLRLVERGSGGRSQIDGGQLEFDLPSLEESNEDDTNPQNPQGLGTDSIYRFGRDAGASQSGLFAVENQGTQPVRVWGSQAKTTDKNGNPIPEVGIYDISNGDVLTAQNRSDVLAPGDDPLVCGLRVDTFGVDVQDDDYDVEITINALVPDE